ncbi:hypothetical protein LRE75_33605 [Streptomyces sp. 372A]
MSRTAPPVPEPRITYGVVLGSPYVAQLLGGTLTDRLPTGMAPPRSACGHHEWRRHRLVACTYVTTDSVAPQGRATEAYAWLILSIGAGQAAGTALTGRLAEQPLPSAALPAAGAAFALAVLLAARRRMSPTGHPPASRHHR